MGSSKLHQWAFAGTLCFNLAFSASVLSLMASVSHKKATWKGAQDPSSHRQPGRPKARKVWLKVPSPEPLVESEDDEDPLLGR